MQMEVYVVVWDDPCGDEETGEVNCAVFTDRGDAGRMLADVINAEDPAWAGLFPRELNVKVSVSTFEGKQVDMPGQEGLFGDD